MPATAGSPVSASPPNNLRLYEQPKEELAHYAKRTVDIQYRFFPERDEDGTTVGRVDGHRQSHRFRSANAFEETGGRGREAAESGFDRRTCLTSTRQPKSVFILT